MTDHTNETTSVMSALFVHAPMPNIRFVRQYTLTDKANINHWRNDGKRGDDGVRFLRMIRRAVWPRSKTYIKPIMIMILNGYLRTVIHYRKHPSVLMACILSVSLNILVLFME